MSVYAAAAQGAQGVRAYQKQWLDVVLTNVQPGSTNAAILQKQQQQLLFANQNLQFANDIMNLVLRNVSQLQP